jgi:two-component system osmolarity sensor histidine kinase EnvZ
MVPTELERTTDQGRRKHSRPVTVTIRRGWNRFWRFVSRYMPKRLYARSLIIVIAPMFLLQSVVAFVFMERNWQTVTLLLSQSVVRDIAAVIDLMETYPHDPDYANIIRIAQDRMQLKVDLLPPDPLPPPGPKPFFSILDEPLSSEITRQINRLRRKIERDPSNPVWLQTVRGIGCRLSVE